MFSSGLNVPDMVSICWLLKQLCLSPVAWALLLLRGAIKVVAYFNSFSRRASCLFRAFDSLLWRSSRRLLCGRSITESNCGGFRGLALMHITTLCFSECGSPSSRSFKYHSTAHWAVTTSMEAGNPHFVSQKTSLREHHFEIPRSC